MQNLRVLLAVGASMAAVAVACSSSSPNNGPAATLPADAGEDTTTTDDSGADSSMGPSCIPLGSTGCSMGQECCLNLSGGLMGGTCVAPGSCTGNIQIECEKGSDCASGQVCCASFGGGVSIAAVQDAGLAALGIDASGLSLDAGAAGLGALGNVMFAVTCQQSCTSSQIQACASTGECAGGGMCVPVSQLLGDGGASLGDAGIPASFAMLAGSLGMVMACTPPSMDAGTTSVPDASGGPDGAGTADAMAPTDAPADSVSE